MREAVFSSKANLLNNQGFPQQVATCNFTDAGASVKLHVTTC